MAIFFITNNGSNDPRYSQSLEFYGDGTSTTISIDLSASPVGLAFPGNNFPGYVFLGGSTGPTPTLSLASGGSVLNVSFASAPASVPGVGATLTANFGYPGK